MTALDRRLVEVREEQGSVWLILTTGETFELSPQSVPKSLPAAGGSISSPLLAEIRLAAERKQVARRVFAIIYRSLQPTSKILDKLLAEGYSAAAVEAVLDQMSGQGLYSDRHYARAWCRDCLGGKDVGRRYLVDKLRLKRIPVAIAREVVDEVLETGGACGRQTLAADFRASGPSRGSQSRAFSHGAGFRRWLGQPGGPANQTK